MNPRTKIPARTVLLVLVALAILLHLPVLGLSFFSDDFSVIHRIGVHEDLDTGSFFRPLSDRSLYLNYLIAGPVPWVFRIVNVILLGVNAWLVHRLGCNVIPTTARAGGYTPLAAGLLFLCYPFHLEPQVWIIARGAALATLFTLAALVIATSGSRRSVTYLFVGLFGALGALCYELALLLPLLLLVLTITAPKKERTTASTLVVLAVAVAVGSLLVRWMLTGHVMNAYGSAFFDRGIASYAIASFKVMGRLFLPPRADAAVQMALFLAVPAGLAILAYLLWRTTRNDAALRRCFVVLTGLLMLSCSVAVVAGVSTRTGESDRFLYLPSSFLCLIVVLSLRSLVAERARRVATALLAALWLLLLWSGMRNWIRASRTIDRIVASVPTPPPDGRLVISSLPGDDHGAFIFRHGFHEALLFAGRDTARIATDTLPLMLSDRVVRWDDEKGFVDR